MKIKFLLAAVFAVILSGCVGPVDSSGWHSSQKSDFLKILKEDKYMSLCDQQALYQKVRSGGNTQDMTRYW